ncbi:MAG: hypothetical protein JO352_16050 [Chloroflexi bacterium]|nr:hypothetical protein [Chloroflexota bacterium]MBV9600257.1 hypothetical protein [Chloroflexota bacterium]
MKPNSAIVLAVEANTGIRSFADIREKHPSLRIATSGNDGVNHIGLAVHEIMNRAGISRKALESWGGGYVEDERPASCLQAVREGRANAIFFEAIMTAGWQDLANHHDLNFVPIEADVLLGLEALALRSTRRKELSAFSVAGEARDGGPPRASHNAAAAH